MKTVGIYGGTFDPVHQGHIHVALEAQKRLSLDQLRLLPCHIPPHRDQPSLNSEHRLKMLQLAIAGMNDLVVDDRELRREGPSYTVDTLVSFRREYGRKVSLVWVLGMDAYCHLTEWYHWTQLPSLANLVVLQRPGYEAPKSGILADWLHEYSDRDPLKLLAQQSAGVVMVLDQSQVDVAATHLREQLLNGELPEGLVPSVKDYIVEHQLYGIK